MRTYPDTNPQRSERLEAYITVLTTAGEALVRYLNEPSYRIIQRLLQLASHDCSN
jgi:hypothetical protein